jgi:hypothetical protein
VPIDSAPRRFVRSLSLNAHEARSNVKRALTLQCGEIDTFSSSLALRPCLQGTRTSSSFPSNTLLGYQLKLASGLLPCSALLHNRWPHRYLSPMCPLCQFDSPTVDTCFNFLHFRIGTRVLDTISQEIRSTISRSPAKCAAISVHSNSLVGHLLLPENLYPIAAGIVPTSLVSWWSSLLGVTPPGKLLRSSLAYAVSIASLSVRKRLWLPRCAMVAEIAPPTEGPRSPSHLLHHSPGVMPVPLSPSSSLLF